MTRKLKFGSKVRLDFDFKLNAPDSEWIDKTSSPHGCHFWKGHINKDGYGIIASHNPEKEGIYKNEHLGVHVAVFLLANDLEEMPAATSQACHKCSGNYKPGDMTYRRCVNPGHLYAGTRQQNSDDRIRESRQAKGEANGRAKLNWIKVREIRSLYAIVEKGKRIWPQPRLAQKFDVDQALISHIINNKVWKEEDDPANQLKEDSADRTEAPVLLESICQGN